MMVRAFSLLATWLGLIVQLRVANAATSNYRNNRNNSTVAEFGGVIFLGGWWDIRPGVDGEDAPSRCEAAVIQAAEAGITRLSFVPTTYWADSGPLDPPPGFDPLCQDLDLSGYYCYDRFESTTMSHWCLAKTPEDLIRHNCDEPTEDAVRVWQLLLAQCLARAVDEGMDIEMNLRVDDGHTLNGWRNTLKFSPTERYGNYSYEEVYITPIVELMSSIPADAGDLALTVAGEMGATVTFYASEWLEVIDRARTRIDASRPGSQPVSIGIQLNANKLCGCFETGFIGTYEEFMQRFEDDFRPEELGIDVQAFVGLLKAVDYVGVSAYVAVDDPTSIRACEFEDLLIRFDKELAFYNTSIDDITSSGTALQLAETGIGGGAGQDGKYPAPDALSAARRPYWGVQGPVKEDHSNDPFQMHKCDAAGVCTDSNEIREYRRYFYEQFSAYLLGEQGGCLYDSAIEAVYLWATGSFDVLELYVPDRGYGDPAVVQTIVDHNAAARLRLNGVVDQVVLAPEPASDPFAS